MSASTSSSTSPSSQSSQPTNQAVPTAHVPTGGLVSPDRVPVRRALISVYDKTGLLPLARALADAGVEIVSTGSTAATIAAAGLAVTPVEEVTGFPECLEGRVKTLHPAVHAGILADRRKPDHLDQLATLGVTPIDLVVVNLYPFTDTVASGAPFDACVEQIDIGGPTMVRAAAKNHPAVAVVTSPDRYEDVAAAVREGGFTLAGRRRLAAEAFAHTAAYDAAVSTWMAAQIEADAAAHATDSAEAAEAEANGPAAPPAYVGVGYERLASLRYGENPHQRAAVYRIAGASGGVAGARQLHGKAMSYNNYTDTDAAVRAAYDHGQAVTVAVVKHANPCGIAVSATGDVAEAHRKAHACDPVSAYGGVIATNAVVTAEMARQIKPIFTEVVAAPAFDDEAVEILSTKKNLRLLLVEAPSARATRSSRSREAPSSRSVTSWTPPATTPRPGPWPRVRPLTTRSWLIWSSPGARCAPCAPTRSSWPMTAPPSAWAWGRSTASTPASWPSSGPTPWGPAPPATPHSTAPSRRRGCGRGRRRRCPGRRGRTPARPGCRGRLRRLLPLRRRPSGPHRRRGPRRRPAGWLHP